MKVAIYNRKPSLLLAFILLIGSVNLVSAQTTAFTYQGKLSDDAKHVDLFERGKPPFILLVALKDQQAQIEKQQRQIGEREHQAALHQSLLHQYHKQLVAQQSRIAVQDAKLDELQQELAALKQLICRSQPQAGVCRARHSR